MAFIPALFGEAIYGAAVGTAEEMAPILTREALEYGLSSGLEEEIFGLGGVEARQTFNSFWEPASKYVTPVLTGLLGVGAGDFVYQHSRKRKSSDIQNSDSKRRGDIDPPSDIPSDDGGYDGDDDDYDGDDDHYDDVVDPPFNPNDETLPLPDDDDDTDHHQGGVPSNIDETIYTNKSMNENRKFTVPPILVRHRSRYRRPPGIQPVILSGYRTYEQFCDGGTVSISDEFRWNDRTDITRQMDFALRNYITQTIYFAGIPGVGIAGVDNVTPENTYSYCLYHKKEYIITNQSTTDCFVVVRLITPKTLTDNSFDACVSDTTFETASNPNRLQYNQNLQNNLTNVVPETDYRFDCFKHRYKVRKFWKQLGKRIIRLRPGDSAMLPVIDKGPWLFSRIALEEQSIMIPGYYRQVVMELRGSDVAYTATPANFATGMAKSGINVIEKTTMSLIAYTNMKLRKYVFTTTAATDNTVGIGEYKAPAQISEAEQRIVNNDDKGHKPMDQNDDQTNTINQ